MKNKTNIKPDNTKGFLHRKPFTTSEREKALKWMEESRDDKRTLCNVVKQVYGTVSDVQGNEWAARELLLEALWMAKRIAARLSLYQKYVKDEMEEKDLKKNIELWQDLSKGNWD